MSTDYWTQAWSEAQATPSGDQVELWCLELNHSSFHDGAGNHTPIRAVAQARDHDLLIEDSALYDAGLVKTFKGIPFELPWPSVEEDQTPTMNIRIDNIGREVMPYLDEAMKVDEALTCTFRCYLFNPTDGTSVACMDPVTFELRQVVVNEMYVQGSASPADLVNLQFGRVVYDLEHYPALLQQA